MSANRSKPVARLQSKPMALQPGSAPAGRRTANLPQASRKAEIVLGTLYLLSALMVRLLSPARWRGVPGLLVRYQTRRPRDKDRAFRQGVRAVLDCDTDDSAIKALLADHETHVHCRSVVVAALRRRGGWDPSIVLIGRERLEAALTQGRGAMLWLDAFAHSAIIGKRAIAEAGFRPWHLSAKGHGILNTPLADRLLNPRVIEVELRYLAGRIVFDPATTVIATRRIVEILDANGVVSITNNAYIGKTIFVPFGAGMKLRLARTPFNLAARRGVALLPVSVIEIEPFKRYEVRVGPDLATSAMTGPVDPIQAMAMAYAGYLLPLVRAHPAQWDGWGLLQPG
jgi:lauroyl/myristoyl acyltransferase